MKPIKDKIHSNGIKLMMIENRFFFTWNTQAKMEQMITATGYKVMVRTKEPLARFTPLSKLMNDNPQMTNQGIKESANRIWLIIRYNFIYSSSSKWLTR
jgi:hypothetical protein